MVRLWRDDPPGAGPAFSHPPGARVAALRAALARTSLGAESLAVDTGGPRDAGAPLLAETARTLHALLAGVTDDVGRDALLRVARLERWLALRGQREPAAACAADLALWVLEHLEAAAR